MSIHQEKKRPYRWSIYKMICYTSFIVKLISTFTPMYVELCCEQRYRSGIDVLFNEFFRCARFRSYIKSANDSS